MTRALFVAHSAELGGAELFLIDLVRGGPDGWRGCFLGEGPAVDALRACGRPPLVIAAGERMLAVRRGSGLRAIAGAIGALITAARRLAAAAPDLDVLCANSQKALFVCAIASRLARRRLLWTLHDLVTDPAFSAANRRLAIGCANRFASVVAVPSKEVGEAFVAAGGKSRLVRIIQNGFDVAAHPPASAAAARRLRELFGLDDRPVVAIFGRLTAWKGQHVFLAALARLPGVQGLLVGAALFGEEAHEAGLRAQAEQLGIADRVRFAGFRHDVAELMAGSDLIVHASTAPEPFGRVVVEAMLAARPVIATDGGAIRSIVTDGETGFVLPPGDAEALAAAMARTLSDPHRSVAMARQARADAASRFSLERMRSDMAAAIAAAVAGH